jgi:hypothetical protein
VPCFQDSECDDGLECRGGGERGGICSVACDTDADCYSWGALVCADGSCALACETNDRLLGELDPAKCGGSEVLACATVVQAPAPPEMPEPGSVDACVPFGLLHPEGELPLGASCDPDAEGPAASCEDVCDRVVGVCRAGCVLQAERGCDVSEVCLPLAGYRGTGDLGVCAEPCNCDAECPGSDLCAPVAAAVPLPARGACTPRPAAKTSLPQCETACTSGALRACHGEGGCLGVQRCLDAETGYSACECDPVTGGVAGASSTGEGAGGESEAGPRDGDSGEGGGGERETPAAGQAAPQDDGGCGMSRRPGASGLGVLLVTILLTFRRTRRLAKVG